MTAGDRTDTADVTVAATMEDAVEAIRAHMARAVAEEDWEELQELDRQTRALVERAFGADPVPLRDDSGAALRAALEDLARFYETSVQDLSQRRGEVAQQIRELKSGRKGTNAYETTRRHSMRAGPGHSAD
ncbi:MULTISPECIES: flagellar protein FliT [unclassified Thioalkalivibrio]|uniref:flagellar protein FliT n=1 Tax=unclassified Thioalkalivibrio TaxID=2621013 RepID=UPI000379C76F|nr:MULTISPECIES: flagellar protein FliT [unclassified Thioalkalivibrio]